MGTKHCTLVPCFTKTTRQLADIEQEIRAVKELYFGNKISYNLANEELQELKDERERLWALECRS